MNKLQLEYINKIGEEKFFSEEHEQKNYTDGYVSFLEEKASRDSRLLSAVPSDFVHRIFIIMDGDKELERLADADTAIDLLLIHQNGEHPRARIFKMKI